MRPIGRLLLLCLLLPSPLLGQYEDLLEVEGRAAKPEKRLAEIEYLLDHPLDPNRAELSELETIPYLSPTLAKEIIRERKIRGRFKGIEDLLRLKGMKRETWLKVSPFLRIEKGVPSPSGRVRIRLKTKWPKPRGILQGNYAGDPLQVYTRGRVRYGDGLEVAFLTEKNPGERRLDDLLTSYVWLQKGIFQIILGNYQAQFGQGLTLWTGYSPRKGEEVIQGGRRRARGLVPYTSADQLSSLQGLGIKLSLRSLMVSTFLSDRRLDATITEEGYASSIYQGGYHRTAAEEEKRNRLRERLYGLRVEGSPITSLRLGSTFYLSQYSPRLYNSDYERKRFSLRGKEKMVGGGDLVIRRGAVELYGELASSSGSWAWIGGAQLAGKMVEVTLTYRHYPPSFLHLYSGGFSDAGPTNEEGLYLGLRLKPLRQTELRFYSDQFNHPWRGYYLTMPWEGEKYLLLFKGKISQEVGLCLRETGTKGETAEKLSDRYGNRRSIDQDYSRRQLRIQLDWSPSKKISLRQRWEKLRLLLPANRREKGHLLRLDFTYHPGGKARVGCGVSFFQTDSYKSRIYIYEAGLPGAIQSLPLFGEGRRLYLWGRLNPLPSIRISLKYAQTLFWGAENTGTGYEERRGNTISEMGAQFDLNL